MTVTGPDFIALQVRDLEKAATFYESVVGISRPLLTPARGGVRHPADLRRDLDGHPVTVHDRATRGWRNPLIQQEQQAEFARRSASI